MGAAYRRAGMPCHEPDEPKRTQVAPVHRSENRGSSEVARWQDQMTADTSTLRADSVQKTAETSKPRGCGVRKTAKTSKASIAAAMRLTTPQIGSPTTYAVVLARVARALFRTGHPPGVGRKAVALDTCRHGHIVFSCVDTREARVRCTRSRVNAAT